MKITIDTQQDSYEDIRKVLHILTQILERKGETGLDGMGTAVDTTNLMSMFESSAGGIGGVGAAKTTDANSLLNLGKENQSRLEKKGEMAGIEVY